ncbi:MAG TPA: EAL domain-containing protein [Sideroxyarcus sp.]|nr:EAL domain-containing protein [Sideroxyarcus sp.]
MDKTSQQGMLEKLSVLFVDDDEDARESMACYLQRRVGKVSTAENGLAGLSLFREQHHDLVISDIRMGSMDGLAMCRAIRESAPDVPVIFVSAHNESDILLSSIDLGITKFLVKPIDTDSLISTMHNVAAQLDKRRNQSSRLQEMNSRLEEAEYEKDYIGNYISCRLDSGIRKEITNLKYLNIPRDGISGDFCAAAQHGNDLYVMLADASGHGIPAIIPALPIPDIFQQRAARGYSLLMIAAEINRALYMQHFAEHFVAATLIRANPVEHIIEVLNCGNPPVLIFDDAGALLHRCHSASPALGLVCDDELSIEEVRCKVTTNARVYFFTDGLTDTLQACGMELNKSALNGLFCSTPQAEVFDALSAHARRAAKQCNIDDISMAEIRFDCESQQEQPIAMPMQPYLPEETAPAVPLSEMTLLYVEDDEVTREYLARYLRRRLGRVLLAGDGNEGLSLFASHKPEIVLTDIRIPLMSGLEMAEEIRKLDRDVPIIVTTGSDGAVEPEKMFELGISRFHMKPLDPNKLGDTLNACIQQANSLNQLRLSASAIRVSSLAAITANRARQIVSVNHSFCRITGYSLDEVAGKNPVLLDSGSHDAAYHQAIWHALDDTGNWSGEWQFRHKNGEIVSEWVTVNAVKDGNGVLSGYHFIFSDIAERQLNIEKLRQAELHDRLTQLPNRTLFEHDVSGVLAANQPDTDRLALLYLNLDCFIEVNNVLGVRVGDKVLFEIARRLKNSLAPSDLLCRMDGDEFALLLRDAGTRDALEQTIGRLSREIKQPIEIDGQEISLHASIGISLYPADGDTYENLVKNACSAVNQARLAGGDTYRFFDKAINQQQERQITLQRDIPAGLQRNEFFMVYQPKYSVSQQRVVGAEALVRWKHPTLGLVSPMEFIPLAESSDAIIEMSEWIIDTVCAQLASWRQQSLPQVPVSINISPVHFWRGDLVGSLRKGLERNDIAPAMLPIEVTEGVVMNTSEKTLQLLGELKTLGFHLSIDDFGTGYSSLKYLKDLPINELKIDRSFIIGIPKDDQAQDLSRTAIPRAIIQMASELNLNVVAEGVETENQKDFLLRHGCDVIQGYLISKPVSAADFAMLLH